jgi:hypothetical protein
MFAGGCVIVAGTAIVASAHKIEQLIGGRFVLGWGIAIMTVAAPRSVHVHCFQGISAHRFLLFVVTALKSHLPTGVENLLVSTIVAGSEVRATTI